MCLPQRLNRRKGKRLHENREQLQFEIKIYSNKKKGTVKSKFYLKSDDILNEG